MPEPLIEVQFDGLPGPTHHFGGMSRGNLASQTHAGWRSRPRLAARQGLAKMRRLLGLGAVQALLPPLPRPDLALLRAAGFSGSDREVLAAAATQPHLLHIATSSAFMWTANCATVIPSSDAADGRCHVVVANLVAMSHRAREGAARAAMLRHLFRDPTRVLVHDPLPAIGVFGDEGAANHVRLAGGQHLFVYGRDDGPVGDGPRRFPARQTRAASEAVARLGALPTSRSAFVRQHPAAIDAGAFHNDVVMVGDGERLLLHALALIDQEEALSALRQRVPGLRVAVIASADLPLDAAVASYLFNSQLITTTDGAILVAPAQAGSGAPAAVVRRLRDDGFIARAEFLDLGESMANGGGPACLRLRVPLTHAELATLTPGVIMDEQTLTRLEGWVDRHYRDELDCAELADPALLEEGRAALDELTRLLDLGPLYDFQR